jgi:7-carboxy-7-deazaguanine synthase
MTLLATPTTTKPPLVVSEVFGPTIQGEGPHAGQRAAFVRLGGCNLTCTWCDTAYTWDARRYDLRAELHRVPITRVQATSSPASAHTG